MINVDTMDIQKATLVRLLAPSRKSPFSSDLKMKVEADLDADLPWVTKGSKATSSMVSSESD